MPLLRIESRAKPATGGRPSSSRPPSRPPSRSGGGSAALSGALIGTVFGLLAVAVLAAALVLRSGRSPAPGALPTIAAAPVSTTLPQQGIFDADYPPSAVIATVGTVTYTMGQLAESVQVARVLASITGDAVPSGDQPEIRGFMVRMLRRQIDVELMKQAAAREGVAVPTGPIDALVSEFVARTGTTEARLRELMAAHGVRDAQLARWFEDTRAVNAYVDAKLLSGREAADRETLVTTWLAGQWSARADEIVVDFYDPDTVLYPAATEAAMPAPAGAAPAVTAVVTP